MAGGARASIQIKADSKIVYNVVSDVPNMPKWAAEVEECRWLGGAKGPVAGAKFKGINKNGASRWWTVSRVTDAKPGRSFAWRVTSMGSPIADWRYLIDGTDDGCQVTESTTDLRSGFFRMISPVATGVSDRDEHNLRNIEETLRNLKDYIESGRYRS
jgi:hypothetical protein